VCSRGGFGLRDGSPPGDDLEEPVNTTPRLLASMALLIVTLAGCAGGESPDATRSPDPAEPTVATRQFEKRPSATAKRPPRKAAEARVTWQAPASPVQAGGIVRNPRVQAHLLELLRGARKGQAPEARRNKAPSPNVRMLLDRLRRPSPNQPRPKPQAEGRIEELLADLKSGGR
jgi:hypothetical protein